MEIPTLRNTISFVAQIWILLLSFFTPCSMIIATSNLTMVMMMVTKVGGLTPLASSPSGDGGFLSLDGGFLGPRPALVHDHIRCDHALSLLINFPSIRKSFFSNRPAACFATTHSS